MARQLDGLCSVCQSDLHGLQGQDAHEDLGVRVGKPECLIETPLGTFRRSSSVSRMVCYLILMYLRCA